MEEINKNHTSSHQTMVFGCKCCRNSVVLDISTQRKVRVANHSGNEGTDKILENVQFFDVPDVMCTECNEWMVHLDTKIAYLVMKLWTAGIHTESSCEGHIEKSSYGALRSGEFSLPFVSTQGRVYAVGTIAPYIDIIGTNGILKKLRDITARYFEEYDHTFYCPIYVLRKNARGESVYRLTVLPHKDRKLPHHKNHNFEVDVDSPLVIVSRSFNDAESSDVFKLNPILVPGNPASFESFALTQLNNSLEVLSNTVSKLVVR